MTHLNTAALLDIFSDDAPSGPMSSMIEQDLQFDDPRCLALEIAKMAHDGQAPAMDCMLAGLRRLTKTGVSKTALVEFIDTLEEAQAQLMDSPSDFNAPSPFKASITAFPGNKH